MGIEILIPLLAIFSIFFVPILGLTIILTTRFALKPLAETIASALRESGHESPGAGSERMLELTEQVQALTDEVHRLREAQEFDRRLLEGRGGEEGERKLAALEEADAVASSTAPGS